MYKWILKTLTISVVMSSTLAYAGPEEVVVVNEKDKPVPVAVMAKTTPEWRFRGYTESQTTGIVGYNGQFGQAAMHAMCRQEVSDNSRACYSHEATRGHGQNADEGWVIAQEVLVVRDPDNANSRFGHTWYGWDPRSGVGYYGPAPTMTNRFNCSGFRSAGLQGLTVADTGIFATDCMTEHAVACCTAVEVPTDALTPLP